MVGVPNPQSDWEQADPKKADFIKNKPDLHSLKEEIYDVVYTDMDGVREDIVVARDDLEGKINLKADTSYVDNKVANIKINTDDKLSTTSTNPVQNKVITSALNTKADSNNAFDGYIEAYNEDLGDITECFDFDSYNADGIYKIYEQQRSDDTVSNHYILCVDTSSYEDIRQTLICLSTGEIKQRSYYGEWEKVSVSQNDIKGFATKTDLNKAIGDIETSLDNIIAKYGLGGDSV